MNWMLMPLRRYAQFSGRARRLEFWLWSLLVLVAMIVATYLDINLGLGGSATGTQEGASLSFNVNLGPLGIVLLLATLIPNLAVSARRLHDIDKSGWMLLLWLVPIVGWAILLYLYLQPGTAGPNRFGPDPKGAADAQVFA